MAEDAGERAKREFVARAPELRTALVAELAEFVARAPGLTHDEAFVLRHVLAYAGYSLEGTLYLPALSVLWGGEDSYIPAVHLPEDRARAAAGILRRRGVLREMPGGAGVVVARETLAELARARPAAARRRVILSVAASLDGFVCAERAEASPEGCVRAEFKRGDPAKQLARLLEGDGGDIYCEGGAPVVHALLKKDLIDVLIVSLIPVLLGDGVPLFKRGRPERRLKLIDSRAFPTGLVQLRYERA